MIVHTIPQGVRRAVVREVGGKWDGSIDRVVRV